MPQNRYLSAQEAADALGLSVATLYAYVSRGLIRSLESGEAKRTRRYLAEDVDKLKARKEGRRSPEKVAAASLYWGTPIMESALTLIDDGRLYYRGQDALKLAQECSIEQVASLLWTGNTSDAKGLFESASKSLPPRCQFTLETLEQTAPPPTLVEKFAALLPIAAVDDLAAYDLRPVPVAQTGARILWLLARIAAPEVTHAESIAHTLAGAWTGHDSHAVSLLNAALILCADHELNVSSFTARCVASAGSMPYHVVMAGLAALQGVKHGGYTEQVMAFLGGIGTADKVRPALAAYLKRGEHIPGFGHRLYPDGDPRCKLLLEMTAAAYPNAPTVALAREVWEEAQAVTGEHPTIDFALATLMQVWTLPPGCGLALFALGRTAGWIAHAIEQYQTDQLIRPRARYTGAQP
jgi:citrate synthase